MYTCTVHMYNVDVHVQCISPHTCTCTHVCGEMQYVNHQNRKSNRTAIIQSMHLNILVNKLELKDLSTCNWLANQEKIDLSLIREVVTKFEDSVRI